MRTRVIVSVVRIFIEWKQFTSKRLKKVSLQILHLFCLSMNQSMTKTKSQCNKDPLNIVTQKLKMSLR